MQTADPLLGRALEGRYRVQSLLAHGGMSTVYVGLDERLDRLVAIKVMSTALSSDPVFVDRFTREARAAARLSHVNVVSVYDQGNDTGHAFLVMELVRGRTLRDLLRESGPLAPAAAVSLMAPVLAALSAAHRAGLVHRDVKPENILLSDDGVVKVADFGLARAIESDRTATQAGIMMGTVAYCSPEQISQGHADPRSDVYAAGIVLYEMLTGAAPFRGESAMAVAYQHVHSRVPAPSDPAGTGRALPIPHQIDTLVQRATSREPAGRPADAGAFLAELHEARIALRMPIVAVPARPRGGSYQPYGPGTQDRSAATTGRLAASGPTGALHPPTAAMPGAGPGYRPPNPGPQTRVQPATRSLAAPLNASQGAPRPPAAANSAALRPPAGPTAAQQNRTRRRGTRRRTIIALLIVLALGVATAVGSWWFVSGRYTAVPDVTSSPLDEATAQLEGAGLDVGEPRTEFSETVAADHVISTDPGPGQRVLPGDTVTLVVSSGAERFPLADLANQSEAQARAALAAIPVQVVTSQASDDSVDQGLVIRTDPPANSQLKRDQVVTVFVSTGPPVITVPDVVKQARRDAIDALDAAGFSAVVAEEYSETVDAGLVIRQTPGARSSAVKFSDVQIVVSLGPERVTLPQLGALVPVSQATAQLEGLGLKVKVNKVYGGTQGLVVGMSPSAGTKVKLDSTVTLDVI